MNQFLHADLIGVDAHPHAHDVTKDGSTGSIHRFGRLIEMLLGYYEEYRYEYINAKPYMALTSRGSELLRSVLPQEFGPNTIEYIHEQVRKKLVKDKKMRGEIGYESMHLPPKFNKLSYDEIVDTLLWYAQYSDQVERELIMEFLLTDGLCESGWREYNEKNKRIQRILTKVGNSEIVQQFPKE